MMRAIVVVVALGLLGSCGGSDGDPPPPEACAPPAGVYEVIWSLDPSRTTCKSTPLPSAVQAGAPSTVTVYAPAAPCGVVTKSNRIFPTTACVADQVTTITTTEDGVTPTHVLTMTCTGDTPCKITYDGAATLRK